MKRKCQNPKCSNPVKGKVTKKYCSTLCNNIAYYYRNKEARQQYARERYNKIKDNPDYVENRKEYFKKWYQDNREVHLKNCSDRNKLAKEQELSFSV